jgi:hypothetical protein
MNRVIRVSLQIALVAIFAAVLFVVHAYIAVAASELPYLFKGRPLMLAALLASSVLSAIASAAIFAYPIAGIYRRFAPLAALAICIPTVVHRTSQIAGTSGKPFVVSALVLEAVALAVLVPLGAWALMRWRYAA